MGMAAALLTALLQMLQQQQQQQAVTHLPVQTQQLLQQRPPATAQ
jgi:hypothetical protein